MTDQLSSAQAESSQTAPGVSGRSGVRVPEQEADLRAIAESSREREWRKPSFAKELYLGRFRLDLIHPHPTSSPEDVEHGERFLAALRDFCERQVDGAVIEREARIPDDVVKGLAGLGAFGIKIPREYGGLGLSHVYYNRALQITCLAHSSIATLLSAHQSIGVPEPSSSQARRSRSSSTFPAAPVERSAPSCSPSRTSAPIRPGWRPRRRRSTTGTPTSSTG